MKALSKVYVIEAELASSLQSVQSIITKLGGVPKVKFKPEITTYNVHLPWSDKIIFALNNIKIGYVDDIIDEILRLEPNIAYDRKTLKNRIATYASKLYKANLIGVKEPGRKKYRYTINS